MSTPVRLLEVATVLLLIVATSATWADEALKVTKLRTEKITFYDCSDGTKTGEYARKDFQGAWPIVPSSTAPPSGLLRAYAVETNKPISANPECGAIVAMAQPKSAATRGLGGDCK
jgi:hypothetical protein